MNANTDNIITGTENIELTLQCNVDSGAPRGSVVWIHNNKVLQHSKSGLLNYTFVPKKTDHLSQYTCETKGSTIDLPLSQTVTVSVSCE